MGWSNPLNNELYNKNEMLWSGRQYAEMYLGCFLTHYLQNFIKMSGTNLQRWGTDLLER